jgi:saccharopine dehydrogenase (NADP+, L-glutamate forming)
MQRVLILGAGLVTGPMVTYLLERGYHVTVASRTVSKAQALVKEQPNGTALTYDIGVDSGGRKLAELVGQADLVVSMLPYTYHVTVAEECIKQQKQMVTTSYVSPAMKALDDAAREAGIIILNEVGLDPGIDHMSAMQVIHGVQNAGGQISSFMSYCGGLPAPEANTNPLGYKFSWSPRGVLLAARNSAHYLKDGDDINVNGPELFKHYWPLEVEGFGQFEAYPNRDSTPYRQTYGIENAGTMYRGTLRNVGWCDTLDVISNIGFLSEAQQDVSAKTYAQLTRSLLPASAPDTGDIKADAATGLGLSADSKVISDMEWLGLFSNSLIEADNSAISPLDLLTKLMLERMAYGPDERDLIVLVHEFLADYPDRRQEHITATLIALGEPGGDSAMARTVSLPAAIAVDLVLQGAIRLTGVQIPVTPELYQPILAGLQEQGIECKEKVETVSQ